MADKTLEIKITADDKELEKSLSSVEKSIKDFAKQSTKASVDVDTAGALKKIESLKKKLKELENNKKSRFDFVYGKSIQTINSVLDKLAKLDKYKNIKVGLDLASNVNKELAKLDKIKSKNVNISINTKGIEDATKKLNALYKVLSKIRKANKVIINTQIKDVGKLPKQALNNGSQSVKAQEASLRQIAKNYAGLAEQAWMDGDLKSFSQYRDMFRVAMNDLVNFKRALGDLSVGGEKTVYSNMARSLKDTSPLYNDIIKKVSQLDSEQKKFNDDVRNVGNAKQQYKTLSTALREVTKEAERAWSVGDKKGSGIAKSQFNDISSLMTQLRSELGTLTVEQEIRSDEKMLRGMSATNPWLAVLKSKLEELYKEKAELEQYIMKLLGENYINPRVRKQLNQYVEEYNYTYSGMLKALIYFYEVKGNSVEKANGGVGIIPWIYKDAYNYYYNLWMIKQRNEDKNISLYVPQVQEITIPIPQRKPYKKNLFSFLDEEEGMNGI